jgi:hypothetical protein
VTECRRDRNTYNQGNVVLLAHPLFVPFQFFAHATVMKESQSLHYHIDILHFYLIDGHLDRMIKACWSYLAICSVKPRSAVLGFLIVSQVITINFCRPAACSAASSRVPSNEFSRSRVR